MNESSTPIARSPITPTPPTSLLNGWETSIRRSDKLLRLADWTSLPKVLHRAPADGSTAHNHPTPFGRARRLGPNEIEIGSEPGAWLVIGPGPNADGTAAANDTTSAEFSSFVDITHGRALLRLSGNDSPRVLEKLCAIDLDDHITPDLTAFRSTVANLVTDVIRDDLGDGTRSYLLHCDRSSGQYLFDSLLDAGAEFDIDIDGLHLV